MMPFFWYKTVKETEVVRSQRLAKSEENNCRWVERAASFNTLHVNTPIYSLSLSLCNILFFFFLTKPAVSI